MATFTKKLASLCSKNVPENGKELGEGEIAPTASGAMTEEDHMGFSPRDVFLQEEPIIMEVNGNSVTVDTKWATAQTSLARYLRTYLSLTGTKIMCAQAGCGSCVVTATHVDPGTGEEITHSINSCITPVFKCNGWKITTVEGLGNTKVGLNETQQRLHDNYGSQCGFCTPGMIMAMNSLLQNKSTPTEEEIKEVIDGNLCRCTGYRPIFDAFLSFGETENPAKLSDIEELVTKAGKLKCPKTKKACTCSSSLRHNSKTAKMQYITTSDGEWMKPETLDDLLALLSGIEDNVKYQLVAGNTGKGVFPNDGPYDQYIDITGITELQSIVADGDNLLVGGSVTLSQLMSLMEEVAETDAGYSYCARIAEHLKKVAHTNVRNVGTVGGNLMMKWSHNDFESDVFNLLECIGVRLDIVASTGEHTQFSPKDFLEVNMDKKVLLSVSFPKLYGDYRFWTYKVTPRNQNAKAYVNGAMIVNVEENDGTVTIIEPPKIVLGGISANFIHATETENYLFFRNINSQETLNGALVQMEIDVNNAFVGTDPPSYNMHLAKALLYKFFIYAVGDNLTDPTLSSSIGQLSWERGIPQSRQELTQSDGSDTPLHTAVKKLEGEVQVTGEAEYTDDIPPEKNELFAAYVIGTIANCNFDIENVNIDNAMAMPGVVDFVTASDIPGVNSVWGETEEGSIPDEIFSSGRLHYAGQAIGLILADTYEHARDAAKAVEITYTDMEPPVLSIPDAIETQRKTGKKLVRTLPTRTFGKRRLGASREMKTVSGTFQTGGQYHFHMETQSCLVKPAEDGHFDIRSATQYMDGVQYTVARSLDIDCNKVDVTVRRLGGGYGGKIYLPSGVAGACAVAANKVNRPVRLVLDIQTNMEGLGKRVPYLFNYTAEVDDDTNIIDIINVEVFCDDGFSFARMEGGSVPSWIQNSYSYGEFNLTISDVATNTPTGTPCRGPSSTQCHAFSETLMEHVATQLGVDPLGLRMANLLKPGDPVYTFNENNDTYDYVGPNPIPDMINLLALPERADYEARKQEVSDFNNNNAFRKRGIAIVPMTWFHSFEGLFRYTVQAASFACDDLLANIDNTIPGTGPTDWAERVALASSLGAELTGRHQLNPSTDGVSDYIVYGACVTEVELDVLTGEKNVRRVDLMADTGNSISPLVDVTQVEGGYVMALGLWLSEEITYDATTGRLKNFDTWTYKPPSSQDIPENFRTYLYDSGQSTSVFSSKATGEPPFLMGYCAMLALRNAINAAKFNNDPPSWYTLDGPAMNDKVQSTSKKT